MDNNNIDQAETGKRVEDIRKSLKMTREEMSDKVGITSSALYNIEKGKLKTIPINTIKLISSTFGIDYKWIMTGEGEMQLKVNPIISMLDNVLEGENETAKAVFRAFAELDESDWKTVQKFIDALKKEGGQ